MYKNPREYIERLEREGELVRVKTPVSTRFEIAEITDRVVKSEGGGKALLFENTDRREGRHAALLKGRPLCLRKLWVIPSRGTSRWHQRLPNPVAS